MSEDVISERPKNEAVETEYSIRWYHIAATAVVLILLVCAIVVFFRRFNPSLVSSDYTMKISAHCVDETAEDRYFGVNAGDLYLVTADRVVAKADNREEAQLEIVELGDSKVDIKIKNEQGEWEEQDLHYGALQTSTVSEIEDCKLVIDYTFNK